MPPVTIHGMDEVCRIYLIGDSLFTDTLAQMLASEAWIQIMGTAVSPQQAVSRVTAAVPHLMIVVHGSSGPHESLDLLLENYPDVPVICADLNQDYVRIITSRRISARRTELLAAIQELLRR